MLHLNTPIVNMQKFASHARSWQAGDELNVPTTVGPRQDESCLASLKSQRSLVTVTTGISNYANPQSRAQATRDELSLEAASQMRSYAG